MVDQIKKRTKQLGIDIIKKTMMLPQGATSQIIIKQIIRSSTAVGSNYRAACIAKSRADMINKLKIVEEEVDETIYWLEVMLEVGILSSEEFYKLKKEACEIMAITVASIKTLKAKI